MLCCFPYKAYEGKVPVFATTPRRSLFALGVERVPAGADGGRQAGRDAGGSVHQPLMMQMPMPVRSTVKSCLSMHQSYVSRVAAASNLQNKTGMHGMHAYLYFCTLCVSVICDGG